MEPFSGVDPGLDFLSVHFDAGRALAQPGLRPPAADAVPLDYVLKCRGILPPEMPESLAQRTFAVADQDSKQRHWSFKARAARMRQRIEEGATASLDRVHEAVPKDGPLAVLRSWQLPNRRVRVVTRHARGVRGVATGTLIAYDQYMNLVLRDVVEQYTVLLKEPRVKERMVLRPVTPSTSEPGAATVSTQQATSLPVTAATASSMREMAMVLVADKTVRWVRRQDHRQRQLGQILLKGDSVVIISLEDAYVAVGHTSAGSGSGREPHVEMIDKFK